MIRVNIFVAERDSDPIYKQVWFSEKTSISEVFNTCNIGKLSASVYVNGNYVDPERWNATLLDLKVSSPVFVSIKHGEIEKKGKK